MGVVAADDWLDQAVVSVVALVQDRDPFGLRVDEDEELVAELTAARPVFLLNSKNAVRIVALGGLGEVGRNMSVIEYAGRLLIVDEDFAPCGVAAEIATQVMEQGFDDLDAPVERLSGADMPMPIAAERSAGTRHPVRRCACPTSP